MRKSIAILTFLFLFQTIDAQDTIRRFEFGSTLVTANFLNSKYNLSPDRPPVEYINGLFFRYTKNRLGLRILASYSDNLITYTVSGLGTPDIDTHKINNKDIRIGVGGQFSILKQKEWFYTFFDILYRNVYSSGYSTGINNGWFAEKFTSTSNGFDCFIGLGFKFKTIKNVYLSPEIGYYSTTQFVNKTTTSTEPGYFIPPAPVKSKYSDTNLYPVFKLHLIVKF